MCVCVCVCVRVCVFNSYIVKFNSELPIIKDRERERTDQLQPHNHVVPIQGLLTQQDDDVEKLAPP